MMKYFQQLKITTEKDVCYESMLGPRNAIIILTNSPEETRTNMVSRLAKDHEE